MATGTYNSIQKQIAKLQSEAEALRRREAPTVLADIKDKIAMFKFTAEDLGVGVSVKATGRKSRGGVTKVATRRATGARKSFQAYSDGKNTWGGAGKRPEWFKKALAAGKTKEQLAVS